MCAQPGCVLYSTPVRRFGIALIKCTQQKASIKWSESLYNLCFDLKWKRFKYWFKAGKWICETWNRNSWGELQLSLVGLRPDQTQNPTDRRKCWNQTSSRFNFPKRLMSRNMASCLKALKEKWAVVSGPASTPNTQTCCILSVVHFQDKQSFNKMWPVTSCNIFITS